MAAHLDRCFCCVEAGFAGPTLQSMFELLVGEFIYLPTSITDRKCDQPMMVAMILAVVTMSAGNKGVQAFQPMYKPRLLEFVQGPINLKRRAKPVAAQLVKHSIGAEWRCSPRQHREYKRLIFCERFGHSWFHG